MTAKRDPKVKAIADLERSYDTVCKLSLALETARANYRTKMLAASRAGVSRAEIGRRIGTSESRVRQTLQRAAIDNG